MKKDSKLLYALPGVSRWAAVDTTHQELIRSSEPYTDPKVLNQGMFHRRDLSSLDAIFHIYAYASNAFGSPAFQAGIKVDQKVISQQV